MEKNSKKRSSGNTVEVSPLDNIVQSKRIELIINDIVAGMSQNKIIEKYMDEWKASRNTITTIYKEAIISLSDEMKQDKEHVRAISNARLEKVWDDCAKVGEKLKTIDLINKTNNLYDNNVVVSTGEDGFHFDIGVEEPTPEYYDDNEENDQE